MTLETGQKAPDFTLPANGDKTISLSELKGKKVVLYFYPKDDTPGCTTEGKDFSAAIAEFEALNTIVFGISKDTVAKHEKFIAKHDFKIDLLSDEDGKMIEDYDVWVEKNMYGRKYMGIERATYLLSEDGTVLQIWRKVKVKGHVDAVLEAIKGI